MNYDKKIARIAGICYLIIFIGAGFSYGYVHNSILVAGDITTTANNIASSNLLFRICIAAGLLAFAADIVVAAIFYKLLKPVNALVSLIAAFFRLLQTAILGMNVLNLLAVLLVADFQQAGSNEQQQALSAFFLYLHQYGFDIAMVFFGIHCSILSWLMFKSRLFPNYIAVLLGLTAVTYLLDSFSKFLLPSFVSITANVVAVTAVVAELALCIWLIAKGVRTNDAVSEEKRILLADK